jgi:steroid delta-isomerase-like uncharacterized protein
MSEANKEIIRRWQEAYSNGKLDEIDDLLAPDWVTNGWPEGVPQTVEMAKEMHRGLLEMVPDVRFTTEEMIAEGDRVVQRWTVSGSHENELFGCPPTGKLVKGGGINIFRIADGKIVEHIVFVTEIAFLEELGAEVPEAWLGLKHSLPA